MLLCLGFSICEIRIKSSSTYRVVLRFRCPSVYENALCKYDYVLSGFIKGWDFLYVCVCVCAHVLSCVWLFVTPMDCSPPGSSVHGTSKARILECGLPFPSPGESFIFCIGRWIFITVPPGKPWLYCMYSSTMFYTSMNWKVRWTIYVIPIYNWRLEKKKNPVVLRTTPSSLRFCT